MHPLTQAAVTDREQILQCLVNFPAPGTWEAWAVPPPCAAKEQPFHQSPLTPGNPWGKVSWQAWTEHRMPTPAWLISHYSNCLILSASFL